MRARQSTLPKLWLVSDARNDAALEAALKALPRGSGFLFRHHHLPQPERRARFAVLARLCRRYGHLTAWAGDARSARRVGAGACYGSASQLAPGPAMIRLATAHSLRELGRARRADAVLLSPVFATASHPGAPVLGPLRFLLFARQSPRPAIALGGMNRRTARRISGRPWAAIDGLTPQRTRRNPKDS